MTENRILHVIIHGRVQGVSFRAWTQHQAELHGLKGWVRNRRDGTVEAVFSGPENLVQVMLKACQGRSKFWIMAILNSTLRTGSKFRGPSSLLPTRKSELGHPRSSMR
jgi:acylphosphatase